MLFEVEIGEADKSGHLQRYRVIAKSMGEAVKIGQQQADADYENFEDTKPEVISAILIDRADPIS